MSGEDLERYDGSEQAREAAKVGRAARRPEVASHLERMWDDLYWTIVASCGRAPTAGEDEVKAAMKAVEAAIRADERAALAKRIEALGEVDDWTVTVHDRLGKELRAVEQAAQGWDDLDALAAAWDDFIEGVADEVVSAVRALVEEANGER